MKLLTIPLIGFFISLSTFVHSQARLDIQNNSARELTIKVMKGSGKGTLHEQVTVSAYGSATVNFSETGYYFTKSKAVLKGKDPLYKKGKSFKVYNGSDGYSVLTLTFSIKESSAPVAEGQTISKSEFDQN